MLVRLFRYHFEEEPLRTESEHCTKSGHVSIAVDFPSFREHNPLESPPPKRAL
jgi:hypothetical protein